MFENLNFLVAIIALIWIGAFAFYLYTSHQQKNIADEVERLDMKLKEFEEEK